MVNYENGKIYKIQGGSMTYIGSTTKQYLSQRWGCHKYDYKKKERKTSAWEIFDSIGIDNCKIILIEAYPCNSIDELRARERYWIEKENCVNRCIPGRTKEEYNSTYILERRKYGNMLIECKCGKTYTQGNRSRHLKKYCSNKNLK